MIFTQVIIPRSCDVESAVDVDAARLSQFAYGAFCASARKFRDGSADIPESKTTERIHLR